MCTRQRHCGDNQCKSSKVEKDEKKKGKKRNQAKLESEKELKVATFFTVFFLMPLFSL